MKKAKFLVFQDNPGAGMQAEIFKRFYWWEERCQEAIKEKFGISIVKKSFKELAEKAKKISDAEAAQTAAQKIIPYEGVSERALLNACKIYLAIKEEIENDPDIKGAGINCLNESFYSDTTPCLAWSLLYEEKGLLWSCEADTMSLATMYLIQKSIDADLVMSNIYPFLMGMAALKHERIDKFPEVEEPQNHLLVVHCGYFGVVPRCIASEWTLRKKVLAIVDENATAIDARLPLGEVVLTKLHPNLDKLMVVKGVLENYVQYPGSDCRNGALIKVEDGYRLMDLFYSHHNCIIVGNKTEDLKFIAKVFDIDIVS
jgi:L-fucose isomerase-like protein